MNQLLLLRHAKSSWDDDGLADRERPLSPRGERDAEAMAEAIAGGGLIPDHVLCSPALRARQTLAALKPRLPASTEIAIAEELYAPPGSDYRDAIAAAGGRARRLMVVGHNPMIQATALALAGDGDPALRARVTSKFPTGALAVIAFDDGNWAGIARAGGGRLQSFLRPRDAGKADDSD